MMRVRTAVNRDTAPVHVLGTACIFGNRYFQFGYSTCFSEDSGGKWLMTWNLTTGHFSSPGLLENAMVIAGSGGSAPGDSGGPVFDVETGRLIGINTGIAMIHREIRLEDAARLRTSPQAAILPLSIIEVSLSSTFQCHFFCPGGVQATWDASSTVPVSLQGADSAGPVRQQSHVLLCSSLPCAPREQAVDFMLELGHDGLLNPYH
ncbi:hypothetical protein L7F22_044428 [Adiantum nelumboides]|nr:hypothetical protein [Adiantum nelumboides]